MTRLLLIVLLATLASCHTTRTASAVAHLPDWMKGRFSDDYGINYTVSDTLFHQHPTARYHILEWNTQGQYILVKNDANNPTEKGLYSRIDYMQFTGMEPYTWGFCLTVYNATDTAAAKKAPAADRNNPRKGCNGFPFSRMKANK